MIIDAKLNYRERKLFLICSDGDVEEVDAINPYFYVLLPRTRAEALQRLIGGEDVWIEPTNYMAIIYDGTRYIDTDQYIVLKVVATSPTRIPEIAQNLRSIGFRIAAHNVRYIIRNTFDLDVRFFNAVPLYHGLDTSIMEKLRRVEGLVLDVEVVRGKHLVSLYRWRPFEEVKRDDVVSIWLEKEPERLRKLIDEAALLIGHNIIGFDLPVLRRAGLQVDLSTKSVFDTSYLLATYGNALKVGSARALLDVAMILAKDAGITEEEIEVKRRVRGRVEDLSEEELIRYNVNDVVITAKLLNIFYPFAAVVSALTQIPISEVVSLPSGMVAEYFLLRFSEYLGYVPEYRPTEVSLKGERVYIAGERKEYRNVIQTDVKMMYPSFVIRNMVDPTLYIGGEGINARFDRKRGIGIIYSAVARLISARSVTKALKKRNPLFEPVDAGVKSILNALAYGVQGKASGDAVMGNPICPAKIFYGTREAQFKAIEHMISKGYKVVYSDTDSFFILLNGREPSEIVDELNAFLKRYGLVVDVEDVWDRMWIYRKKNYILRKGNVVVLKGSALISLQRFYLPEAVSLRDILYEEDRDRRLKLLKEMIESAAIEDLFIRGHQMLWRLIGVDVQRIKRLRERRNRYMMVMTEWGEKPVLYLKKGHVGHFILPHSNPVFNLFIENGEEVDLSSLNPFSILELRTLPIRERLSLIKARYMVGDMLIYTDRMYSLKVSELRYVLRIGDKERSIPTNYSGTFPQRPVAILKGLRASIQLKPIEIDEDFLRRVVLEYAKDILKRFALL